MSSLINSQNARILLEIDSEILKKNIKAIQQKIIPSKVMAVVKANAYGLGIENIAPICFEEGILDFGIAEVKESFFLRKRFQDKINIYVLGSVFEEEMEDLVTQDIIIPIDRIGLAKTINDVAQKQNKIASVQILIDSGMGRLGCLPKDFVALLETIEALSHLDLVGIYSHLSNANQTNDPYTQEQITTFDNLIKNTPSNSSLSLHLANSDGINNYSQSYYDMVRTGINLYGVFDLKGKQAYSLEPTLTLKTHLIAKRKLPKGHGVGYGVTYKLPQEATVGTLPIGYADGSPMALGNKGEVLIRGKRCRIIGRVSMDYITVDLTPVSDECQVNDEVILLGKRKEEQITVEDWAKIKNTHPYDILCGLGERVKKILV